MSRLPQPYEPQTDLAQVKKDLLGLQRHNPSSIAFSDGTRVRTRIGLQDDGKYGLRVWNAAGTLVVDQTA